MSNALVAVAWRGAPSVERWLAAAAVAAATLLGAGCASTPPAQVVERSATAQSAETAERRPAPEPEAIERTPLSPEDAAVGEALPAGASSAGPPVVVALVETAEREAAAGALENAAAALERALAIDPQNPSLWYRLGELRLDQGQPEQAIQMASKAATLAGDDAALRRSSWLLIAHGHRALGDEASAQDALRRADAP